MSEPISPELVLVDPELARAERARLLEHERNQAAADRASIPPPVEPAPVPVPADRVPQVPSGVGWEPPSEHSRKRLTPALLTVSLMANAILIAVVIAGARGEPSPALPVALTTTAAQREDSAVPTTTHASKAGPTRQRHTQRPSRPRRRAALLHETSGEVERKILNLVIQSPRGKLPSALIDPKTGLAKNSLQAVCRRNGGRRSFLCIVRPARHRPTEGLYVRYRPARTGRGAFTWYRYRRG